MGHFCVGNCGDIRYPHKTLQAAKVACSNDIECGCIYDAECDGGKWWTCKGSNTLSDDSLGSCVWITGRWRLSSIPESL